MFETKQINPFHGNAQNDFTVVHNLLESGREYIAITALDTCKVCGLSSFTVFHAVRGSDISLSACRAKPRFKDSSPPGSTSQPLPQTS